MSDLILQIAVSLDGFIEDQRGSIDFMEGDTSLDAVHTATLRSIDGMIFGRKAHALLADYARKCPLSTLSRQECDPVRRIVPSCSMRTAAGGLFDGSGVRMGSGLGSATGGAGARPAKRKQDRRPIRDRHP